MSEKTIQFGKAFGFAVLIWVVGFVWGSVVFMTPALKALPSIPYVSRYPAISFPLLLVFAGCAYSFARRCAPAGSNVPGVALRIGTVFAVVNLLLDLIVLVLLLRSGWSYFASVTVWLSYAILLFTPRWALH